MTLGLNTTTRNNRLNQIKTAIDAGGAAGFLRVYVGTPPAGPDFFIRLPKNPRHVIHH